MKKRNSIISLLILNSVIAFSQNWKVTGNNGTNPSSDFLGTQDNQPLVIKTNNTERVRILNSGFVGIGNANPLHKLSVAGNIAFNTNLVSRTKDAGIFWGDGISGDLTFNTVTSSEVLGGAIPRMRIAQNGNVVIGNPSGPASTEMLDVEGNISVRGTHLVYNSQHGVIDWGSGGFGDLYFRHINDGAINTYTDLAHIKYNGNFAIGGGFDPQAKLHVLADAAKAGVRVDLNGVYGSYLSMYHAGSAGSVIDPIGSGILNLGSDQATDIRIGSNYTNGTNAYSKLGIGVPSYSNINAFFHVYTPDVNWHGLLIEQNYSGSNLATGAEVRMKNINSEAFAVSSYTNIADPTSLTEFFKVMGNGKTTIGKALSNSSPYYSTYSLSVSGTGVFQELIVTDPSWWPDYVFEKNYKLTPLKEVETYYKENKHLPLVPSAKEVEEKGISVGEMNKILLKKIEELTLYVVEQQKQIDEFKSILVKKSN